MDFSWTGLLVAALVLLPNLLFVKLPPKNVPEKPRNGGIFIGILEHGGRILTIGLLILTTKNGPANFLSLWLFFMAACLIAYYILWVRYVISGMDYRRLFDTVCFIPLPMAVFPILYLLLAAFWFNSFPLIASVMIFAGGHLINSYITFRQLFHAL